MRYNVGDKVRVVFDDNYSMALVDRGTEGIISLVDFDNEYYTVVFDHNFYQGQDLGRDYWFMEEIDLELVD